MSWIKRNLYFLIGSVFSLALLAVAVVYYLQQDSANNAAHEKLNKAYSDLKHINDEKPHPGYPNPRGDTNKVDNILLAEQQLESLRSFLTKTRAAFVPAPPIPDTPRVTGQQFTADLLRTIDQMRREAQSAGVTLPATNYNFAFDSIVPKVTFSHASLTLLARQLGEIKTLCDVLFEAKINAIDGLRRLKVCAEDDTTRFANDYVSNLEAYTNQWGVLVPYQLNLRCFSSELAGVLSGFANSPNAILVKSINIEPVAASASPYGTVGENVAPPPPTFFVPATPAYPPPGTMPPGPDGMAAERAAMMRRRYGVSTPMAPPPPSPVFVMARPPANRGPQIVINENAVRVTMTVVFVQVESPAVAGPGPGRPRRSGGGQG